MGSCVGGPRLPSGRSDAIRIRGSYLPASSCHGGASAMPGHPRAASSLPESGKGEGGYRRSAHRPCQAQTRAACPPPRADAPPPRPAGSDTLPGRARRARAARRPPRRRPGAASGCSAAAPALSSFRSRQTRRTRRRASRRRLPLAARARRASARMPSSRFRVVGRALEPDGTQEWGDRSGKYGTIGQGEWTGRTERLRWISALWTLRSGRRGTPGSFLSSTLVRC